MCFHLKMPQTVKISEDCQQCTEDIEFGSKSSYYMTGNYKGCLWVTKGVCDMDTDTLECSECEAPHFKTAVSGVCSHLVAAADQEVSALHDDCTGSLFNAFPAIGTNGRFCVCYRPSTVRTVPPSKWTIDEEDVDEENDVILDKERVVRVYADDFVEGTYRITMPGIYILMENVELEMNGGDYENPNGEGIQWIYLFLFCGLFVV